MSVNCLVGELSQIRYNDLNDYCRELDPGTVSLTGDRAQGDDSKQSVYSMNITNNEKSRMHNTGRQQSVNTYHS